MRLRPCLLAAPAAVLLLAAPAAFAQTPPPGGPPGAPPQAGGPEGAPGGMHRGMGMGMMPRSADQVPGWAERVFSRLDANADGAITGNELTPLTQEPVASMGGGRLRAMVSQSDANRDARVSLEEFTAGAQRAFTRLDANGDGQLSDEEMPRPAMTQQRPVAIPMPTQQEPMPMPMPDGSGG